MDSLPPELWQIIVEYSASSSSDQAKTLSLVSHLFHSWVRPIQYNIFYCDNMDDTSPGPLEVLWFERNGKYIQHLFWGVGHELLPSYLPLCTNLKNFALWYTGTHEDLSPVLTLLNTTQPRRLSINLPALWSDNQITSVRAQDPGFQNLTHLDLIAGIEEWVKVKGLAEFPCLTHLALSSRSSLDIVHNALRRCKALQILIFLRGVSSMELTDGMAAKEGDFDIKTDDPRVVAITCRFEQNWTLGAKGGKDMWLLAEEIVANRSTIRSKPKMG